VTIASAAKPAQDKVVPPLPLIGNFTFEMYSGYIEVEPGEKWLHYVFVESQNDPATDPLILWTNGGPACSSMIGFVSENGPF
jgi:carboxypeptidase C (cathepsin A)